VTEFQVDRYYRIPELAECTGYTEEDIYQALKTGKMKGFLGEAKGWRGWIVHGTHFRAWQHERRHGKEAAMRRAEWVDLDMRDGNGLPMHAEEGCVLGVSWSVGEVRIEALRLQELEESRLHISITPDGGDVLDYIFHGHYLIKWAPEEPNVTGPFITEVNDHGKVTGNPNDAPLIPPDDWDGWVDGEPQDWL